MNWSLDFETNCAIRSRKVAISKDFGAVVTFESGGVEIPNLAVVEISRIPPNPQSFNAKHFPDQKIQDVEI